MSRCQATISNLAVADDTLIGRLKTPPASDAMLEEPQLQAALGDCPDFRPAKMGLSPSDADSPPVPKILGEYELRDELGHGGMGRVYRALHTKLDRVVALKVLNRGRATGAAGIARFAREMRAVGQFNHPNIVQAHDAREVDGTSFLIMEYVDGLDLSEIVRRLGPLAVADACELVRQTALALQCAHEHGLVHRDVKPSNVMLSRTGEVKLLDLGLARFFDEDAVVVAGDDITHAGQAMGTADYMAPEQASDSRSVDIRADLYSLGCTLYKLLCGRAPFSGPDYRGSFDKLHAHLHDSPPPIRQLAPNVPEKLAALIDRLLAKAPAARPATPAEVAETLTPFCRTADLETLIVRAVEAGDCPNFRPAKMGLSPSAQPTPKLPLLLTSWGWRRLTGQLVLLLMAGILGFAAGVIITIKKDGQQTTIEVPDGANARIDSEGRVDVTLPGAAQPDEADRHGETLAARSERMYTLWSTIQEKLRSEEDNLQTLQEKFGPRHPNVVTSRRRIEELQKSLANVNRAADATQFDSYRKVIDDLEKAAQEGDPAALAYANRRFEAQLRQIQATHAHFQPALDARAKSGTQMPSPPAPRRPPKPPIPVYPLPAPASEQPQSPLLEFGAVVERVVNAVGEAAGGEGLDLASGKLVDVPKEFGEWSAEEREKWSKENAVNLFVDMVAGAKFFSSDEKVLALVPEGMKLAVIKDERWQSTRRDDLVSILMSGMGCELGVGTAFTEVLERRGISYHVLGDAPRIFAFQTHRGDLGILQVLRFTEAPRGVRVRYKLAKPTTLSPAAELNALLGEWRVVNVEKGRYAGSDWETLYGDEPDRESIGKPSGNTFLGPLTVSRLDFREGALEIIPREYPGRWPIQYTIDPTLLNKGIELFHDSKTDGQLVAMGIYKMEGDRLELLLRRHLPAVGVDQRPNDFMVAPDSADVLFTLARVRPDEALIGEWKMVRMEKGKDANAAWSKIFHDVFTLEDPVACRFYFNSTEDSDRAPGARFDVIENMFNYWFDPRYAREGYFVSQDYRTDTTGTLKTINLLDAIRGLEGLGIYEIDDNRLKICLARNWSSEKDDRPSQFAARPDSADVLFVLERVSEKEKAVEGQWTLQTKVEDGAAIPKEQLRNIRLGMYGIYFTTSNSEAETFFNVVTKCSHGVGLNVPCVLDPVAQPSAITIYAYDIATDERQKVEHFERHDLHGIYQLDANRLTIAYRRDGPRPETFESTPGSGVTLLVLERKDAGPEEENEAGEAKPPQPDTAG